MFPIDTEIVEMWEELKSTDSGCGDPQSLKTKSAVTENALLSQFFSHCCRERHYYFEIKSVARLSVIFLCLKGVPLGPVHVQE